jgi:hypothetical protein
VDYAVVIIGIVVVLWLAWSFIKPSPTSSRNSTSPASATRPPISQREQIVVCPSYRQRNRLREADAPSLFRCGNCRAYLPTPFAEPATKKPEPIPTFRPSSSTKRDQSAFSFCDVSGDGDSVAPKDLAGLVDAFTGEALNTTLGLYQCGNCGVYYHTSSFEVIQSENHGRCVACLLVKVRAVTKAVPGSNSWENARFKPEVVTLDNYRNHVGLVITFEGVVRKVVKSRSGKDYAAMFEDKDWTVGLKMVFLRGKITAAGGGDFIRKLSGRTIRVRGLLQKHPIFGFQIAVSERRMIEL